MVISLEIIIFTIWYSLHFVNTEPLKSNYAFPADFEFGTATSAHQIEGAWNEDGKTWSMWDHLARNQPEYILDGTNADTAANSYHMFKRDVQMLKELGVTNYRFSISWTRIMPNGRGSVNPKGIAHYNDLIDELLANGITPFVTIYHWDLPQTLNEQGGWLNEDIVDWFGDYARVLYENFGDRVKHWLTVNEPYIHCYYGYGLGLHAPLIKDPGVGYYECGRNLLLASARAYHFYNDEFKPAQNGVVGIVFDQYMHPLLGENGNYPQTMIDRVAAASTKQGLKESRLRPFSEEQIQYIKGSIDFLGINQYTSLYIYRNSSLEGTFQVPSVEDDNFIGSYTDPAWPLHGFVAEYAPGIYHTLKYVKDKYNNPLVYITENGCPSPSATHNDLDRIRYYRTYMQSVLDALAEGVNIKGYFAWSLMDNFEWSFGYGILFGLYSVDMDSPDRTRTPRKSAMVLKEIIKSRVINSTYEPDPSTYGSDKDSVKMPQAKVDSAPIPILMAQN